MVVGRRSAVLDAVVFGGLAIVAVASALPLSTPRRSTLDALALVAVAILGFYTSVSRRLPRAAGCVAFLVAWWVAPWLAIAGLATLAWARGRTPPISPAAATTQPASHPCEPAVATATSPTVTQPGTLTPRWRHALPALVLSKGVTPSGLVVYVVPGDNRVMAGDELYVSEVVCRLPDGRLAWRHRMRAFDIGGLAVMGEDVYVCGPDIVRLDADSGRVLARRPNPVAPQTFYPRVDEHALVVMPTYGPAVGLDRRTLETVWEWPDAYHAGYDSGCLWFEHGDGDVEIVEPRRRERRVVPLPRSASTMWHGRHGGLIFRFAGTERLAVDIESGAVRWRHVDDAAEPSWWIRQISDGMAFFGADWLAAYDLTTGRVRWRRQLRKDRATPSFAAGRIFHAARGALHVWRQGDGAELAHHALEDTLDWLSAGPTWLVAFGTGSDGVNQVQWFDFDEGITPPSAEVVVSAPEERPAAPATEPPDLPKAAEILRDLERAHGWRWFERALADADPHVRTLAIRRLGDTREVRATAALAESVTNDTDTVRGAAAWALGCIGTDEAARILIGQFEREVAKRAPLWLFQEMARALTLLPPALAVPPLLAAYAVDDMYISSYASSALTPLGAPEAIPALATVVEQANHNSAEAVDGLVKIGVAAVPVLVSLLEARNIGARVHAAYALGRIRSRDALGPLHAAAHSKGASVRAAVAEALGSIQAKDSVPTLLRLLVDTNWAVRRSAAEALGRIGDPVATDALIVALSDEDPEVRGAAADAVASHIDARAAAPLLAMLAGDGPHAPAARAVSSLGARVVDGLSELLHAESFDTRYWSTKALDWIGSAPKART